MRSIAILGCGHMGQAYASSFVRNQLVTVANLYLVEHNPAHHARLSQWGSVSATPDARLSAAELIIVSVKPQDADVLLAAMRPLLRPGQVVLSIMAGVSLAALSRALGHPNLIRAMPNMPAQYGMGITAYTAAPSAEPAAVLLAERMLSATGKTVYLTDEAHLDAVTAVSGSGPAYFYFVAQAMTEAARALGLEDSLAALLVKETLHGAFHVQNATGQSYAELIGAVASRGGTTEAALEVFRRREVAQAFVEAIAAAARRSHELGQSLSD